MTIDEAIKDLECGSKQLEMEIKSGLWIKGSESELRCREGIILNKQYIKWLKELKDLREENKVLIQKCDKLIKEKSTDVQPDNGWISVKDKLPDGDGNVYYDGLEESKYVLVYGCYKDDYGYGIGTYIRDHIEHDAGWSGCLSGLYELDCCNVTHWQYLPEPPKGE